MRIINKALATTIALLVAGGLSASFVQAAPIVFETGATSANHLVLVKAKKKVKKAPAKKVAKKKVAKKAKAGPGKCGTGKYYSKKTKKCEAPK